MFFPNGASDPYRSDLFIHDTTHLASSILLPSNNPSSHIRYHEYAVYAKDSDYASTIQSAETDADRPFLKHTGYSLVSDDGSAFLHQAVRDDFALDATGTWGPRDLRSASLLQGRVRVVTCLRRANTRSSAHLDLDGLHLTANDFAAMDLHPATLQYVRRRAVESSFWDRHHEKLSILLSLPANSAAYDFLSMTYDVSARTTTVLIRQSFDPARHSVEELEQYESRMQACKAHWAHPLVLPVVVLQVQFGRMERAVGECHAEVIVVEKEVANMAGFDALEDNQPLAGGIKRQDSGISGGTGRRQSWPQQVPKKSTELMRNAHDVLKTSISLLDTLNWMERAIRILLDAGDELEDVRQGEGGNNPSTPVASAFPVPLSAKGRTPTGFLKARIVDDPLAGHWHEIRQYLEGLQQLCQSLKVEREILQTRCEALVDIIYSKIAQEDNSLNARMAVASSRDSSSMKALAVITAVFLPGEFMSSLFGMGIFNWQPDSDADDGGSGAGGSGGSSAAEAVVGYDFWIYWATTVPLTILILVMWRAWWVGQDRYFRKHLSKELSEERYWTDDRRPRELETSFFHDFLYMSVRKGETVSQPPMMQRSSTMGSESSNERRYGLRWLQRTEKRQSGLTSPSPTFRLRQIAFEDIDVNKRRAMV